MKSQQTAIDVLGVYVKPMPLDSLILEATDALEFNIGQIAFACANPHSVVVAQEDHAFLDALNSSEQLVPDGVGLIWLARLFGANLAPRVTGYDYYRSVMRLLDKRKGRVFFLGSTDYVLGRIADNVTKDYPGIEFVAGHSPPFGRWPEQTEMDIIEKINQFRPDVLWVGMTAPKQERWVAKNRSRINVPVIGSVGAVFDFYAGTHKRAPEWVCAMGFEWLFRLVREPRRMWRRSIVSAPRFVFLALKSSFGR